jgi:hypothetical protein
LIENQPAFHFAFIPINFSGARGEIRTLNFQILSLTPLPLGIRAPFFRTIKLVLAAGFEPSTVQFLKLPSPASWTTRAFLVLPERLELSSTRLSTVRVCQLRHGSLKFVMPTERFELSLSSS